MTSATDPYPHAPEAVASTPSDEPVARPDKAPRWSLPVLGAILVLAGLLYSWNLSSSSLNSFYSAAVFSGTQSWKAWFFGSLDAGNFLTVDKPPVVLMVMGLSCRVFGYGTWQMMLPLVAAALGTIWILHASVKRVWGHGPAAVAALVLALTPITVAINRDNNPDTLLVLLMVAGAALALRAVHNGKLLPLVGAAVCFGFAFNTKMLQGYIALPAVFAVYLYAAQGGLLRRVRDLAVAAVTLAVSSFWWAAAVSFVPASSRPYIGGSTDGTAWDLIMGYNGLGRVLGGDGNGGGGGGGGGGGFSGTAGIGRMFNETLGGQISWLLPFAGIALVGGLVLRGRAPRTDLTRAALILWGGWTALHYLTFSLAEGTMHPYYTTALAPGIAALCGGGGAMLLHAFRTFRTGDAKRWSGAWAWTWTWALPVAFAATGVWAVVLLRRASGWNSWLWPTVAAVMVLAIVGLFLFRSGRRARLLSGAVVAAVVASLAGPAAYAVSVPASSGGGMSGTNPTAGPTTGGGMGGGPGGGGGGGRGGFPGGNGSQASGGQAPGGQQQGAPQAGGEAPGGGGQTGTQPSGAPSAQEQGGDGQTGTPPNASGGGMGGGGGGMGGGADSAMTTYLEKHRDGAKWLVAVSGSQSAAQLIVSTKQPVISMWGWSGSDKAMTLAKLKELVTKGELHYIVLGGAGGGGAGGMGGGDSDSVSSEVTAWVQKHATAVKASEYGSGSSSGSATSTSQDSEDDAQNTQALYRLDASDVG
ncbi:ArnT family glycosyltransferase [Streptomyces aurantiacus]|uniref:ArnT family glycosyltransferase n=1 Tax=Streptomyces aurantiacus TaxID=47760 RepID=UPI0006E35A42|nr:glycosyltransferase family 39 protein [Streptomyces aurantiacus]